MSQGSVLELILHIIYIAHLSEMQDIIAGTFVDATGMPHCTLVQCGIPVENEEEEER